MSTKKNTEEVQNDKEVSLKEIVVTARDWMHYIAGKWKTIVAVVLIGMGLGLAYSIIKEPQYTAECSFVFEESNSKPDLGGLAAIGLDVGGNSGGLFSATSNIIWLYSSKLILQKTLLTNVDDNGKKRVLIDWFIEESNLQKKFKDVPSLQKIKFLPGKFDADKLTRDQNTIISSCIDLIKGRYLKVTENKGTKNIILVNFTSKNELLSLNFTKELVEKANDFYIQTKTKKTGEEVAVLQGKVDSFKGQMDKAIFQTATAVDATPNLNPAMQVLRVKPQQKSIDVQVNSAIYTEMFKMLEKRKMDLAQETPLIQVIDEPVLPLNKSSMGKIKGTILGGLIFAFLIIIVLIVAKIFKGVLS